MDKIINSFKLNGSERICGMLTMLVGTDISTYFPQSISSPEISLAEISCPEQAFKLHGKKYSFSIIQYGDNSYVKLIYTKHSKTYDVGFFVINETTGIALMLMSFGKKLGHIHILDACVYFLQSVKNVYNIHTVKTIDNMVTLVNGVVIKLALFDTFAAGKTLLMLKGFVPVENAEKIEHNLKAILNTKVRDVPKLKQSVLTAYNSFMPQDVSLDNVLLAYNSCRQKSIIHFINSLMTVTLNDTSSNKNNVDIIFDRTIKFMADDMNIHDFHYRAFSMAL